MQSILFDHTVDPNTRRTNHESKVCILVLKRYKLTYARLHQGSQAHLRIQGFSARLGLEFPTKQHLGKPELSAR